MRLRGGLVTLRQLVMVSVRSSPILSLCTVGGRLALGLITILMPIVSSRYIASLTSARELQLSALSARSFIPLVLVVAGMTCLPPLVSLFQAKHAIKAEHSGLIRSLRSAERLNGLRYFDSPMMHDKILLSVQGFADACKSTFGSVIVIAQGAIAIVGLTIYMLSISFTVVLGIAVAMSFTLIGSLMAGKTEADGVVAVIPHDRYRRYLMFLATSAPTAEEVTAFGMRPGLGSAIVTELGTQRSKEFRYSLRATALQLSGYVGTLIVLTIVVQRLIGSETGMGIDTADLGGLVIAIVMTGAAAMTFGSALGSLLESVAVARQLQEFEALPPAVSIGGDLDTGDTRSFSVELVDVWFRYAPEQPWVMRGLSGRIEAGSSVAIVGANGCGKSTMMKLLAKLYEVDSGRVLVDGIPIDAYSLNSIRSSVCVLFQDYQRYDMTLRENIRLMDESIEDDLIMDVCDRVDLDVSRRSTGLDLRISRAFGEDEYGFDLSGGQWQRVAAARVLVRQASLLILDEPSASLDPDAEAAFFADLRRNVPDATIITVSHRLSHTALADKIWVMDGGRIVEQGTHADLLDLGGHYARMFLLQGHYFAP